MVICFQVDGSARSSFSARFFAKSSRVNFFQPEAPPAPAQMKLNIATQALLEEDEDEELTLAQLLSAERERLKLKDLQVSPNNTSMGKLTTKSGGNVQCRVR